RIDFALSYLPTKNGLSGLFAPLCYNYGVASHPSIEVTLSTSNRAACNAANLAANPATVNWVRYRPSIGANAPMANSPLWNGSGSYQHIFDLSSGATITAQVQVKFASLNRVANFYDGYQPAYHKTNLSVTYETADSKWSLNFWVRNLENLATYADVESTGV